MAVLPPPACASTQFQLWSHVSNFRCLYFDINNVISLNIRRCLLCASLCLPNQTYCHLNAKTADASTPNAWLGSANQEANRLALTPTFHQPLGVSTHLRVIEAPSKAMCTNCVAGVHSITASLQAKYFIIACLTMALVLILSALPIT
ncbi:hypothetical protein EGR_08248 [Echinococcus granulosus]|uniref:Uncharacterized protein n=1 Tax=Echinococcus granulosus TaxID=6210 RepID=W6U8U4_ECHGR|nr:hypothetical protein EGR_08248 [Echinococcus granulosus]EUB56896.1 hypothetical protein EGR_08248 [Echinococcus granulosus]